MSEWRAEAIEGKFGQSCPCQALGAGCGMDRLRS
jgi:hypothetical protein